MKKIIIIVLVTLVVLAVGIGGAGAVWFTQNLQPADPANQDEITFVIPKGQGVLTIGRRLQEEGLIKDATIFRLLVKKEGLGNKIQAGSFTVKKSMTPLKIAETFTQGSEDQWVTIPEGLRREEIAELFSDFSEFNSELFLDLTEGKEGYLYPDTYLFPKAATTEFIVSYLSNTFENKTKELQAEIANQGKDWEEQVVLASLVQREAKTPEQMKQVAGILNNRLEIDQALQVDATLQYIKGDRDESGKWWATPLAIDKELNSPFNTYQNAGLPPAPICNPGLDALTAVVEPIESENFFYLHAPDGKMYYGETYDEHLVNIAKYLW